MARTVSVRGLTEGAVLAALVTVLALAANYLPLVGVGAFFLCPLPLAVLTVRHGLRVAVLTAAVAAAIGGMIGGVLTGVSIAVGFGPTGLAMGVGIRRKLPATSVWLLTASVTIASVVVSAGLAMLGVGLDPRRLLMEMIQHTREGQQTAIDLYERLGLSRTALQQSADLMQQVIDLLPRMVPLLLVVGGATGAYINLVIGRAVMRRLRLEVPAFPPISQWRVPAWFTWVLPVGMLLLWASTAVVPVHLPGKTFRMLAPDDVSAMVYMAVTRYPILETAGLNLTILAQTVFSLLGLVVCWALMAKYQLPLWYRLIVLSLALPTPLFGVVVLVLGVADAAFDLRGRWRSGAAQTSSA